MAVIWQLIVEIKFSTFSLAALSISSVARCLKITEKVSFKIASEASYVYILSRQKLIKNAPKMVNFDEFLT